MKRFVLLGLLLGCVICGSAQELRDTLHTYFRSSSVCVDTLYMQNNESLSSFFQRNLDRLSNPTHELKMVKVVGGSSPEGTVAYNETLALKRARSLADYLMQQLPLAEDLMEVTSLGVDWSGLTELVLQTMEVPNREEVLSVLQKDYSHNERLYRLKQVDRSIPYRWMYKHLFPQLRQSRVIVHYIEKPTEPEVIPEVVEEVPEVLSDSIVVEDAPEIAPDSVVVEEVSVSLPERKYVSWALKTNALYDVLLVPNIGVEFHLGKNWSAGANWMYAWWNNDTFSKMWRVYGGDIYFRKWFGKKAKEKPFAGHHLGAYFQMMTYDFCNGKKGYMGGDPESNLWDRASFAGGIEYGYSLPVARRLNLDFTLGIGYLGGKYYEYKIEDDCRVWQATKNRKWIGPTRAEVSLVWLLGKTNINKEKGGCR